MKTKTEALNALRFSNLPGSYFVFVIVDKVEELAINIFAYLDPSSVCNSSKVSKQWNRLCSELWRDHCLR
jgi:hypothetical protein